MPVTQDKPGPYAPTSAVMGIVERFRERGLPTPITAEVLARAGITESLIPRTLYALQVLDLINAEGKPTSVFEAIRLAPEAEYQGRLGEWLTAAYADALQFVDPATADETKIHDAFRSYTPPGQRDRMVSLFMGLFRAAGIAPEKSSQGSGTKKRVLDIRPRLRATIRPKAKESTHAGGGAPKLADFDGGLPPAIAGLLASLPTHGQGWTKAERDGFMHTFGVVLDFVFPPGVVKPKKAEADDEADA